MIILFLLYSSANNNSDSFNFKVKITGPTEDNDTKVMVSLKYLSNFLDTWNGASKLWN